MIGTILDLIIGPLGAALGAIAAVAFAFMKGRSSGKKGVENEFHRDKSERQGAGRDKVREGRDSGLSPADRVRRNDSDWRGM